ncbi:histidine kinase [Conexibacter sp. DBS9H8]|uniref:histidine kinase n=1 Tax=Conexibacter sp. DBS9H8 TaxID=2937801 RepID=UPI00200ECB21|nr:histidine kinase [Conexibacter sp. DBS9H8]
MARDLTATVAQLAPPVGRGRHKIFLGMAAGVGKTYRMLQEGRAEAEAGRDVVIGYLEPHDRPDTAAQAVGLEVLPRRGVSYRNNRIEELDLVGILTRDPELCLIDELAHTNAPGVEHAKRYEDVEEVLAAGVDVYSTVNVQHLEGLNDRVSELTGIRVRETIPDRLLSEADEVVLVDLTPEALIERLRAGKIYPPDAIGAALDGFFRIENLAALRETALRQVAEEVEAKRVRTDHADRLLALITPQPGAQRIVRRAWRTAQRIGAELDVLWVAGREPTAAEEEQLAALRSLTSVLGAHLLVEYGEPVAEVIARVVGERASTFVVVGAPRPRGSLARLLAPELALQLLARLPGVDVQIVAARAAPARHADREERS